MLKRIKSSIVALSLLVNLPVLFEAPIIAQFIAEKRLFDIWIIWGGSFGFAFGLIFIAPLWKNIPSETENGFHLFRYEGKWAQWLYSFRAVFLGLMVVPLIASLNLHSFAALFSLGSGLSGTMVVAVICVALLFTTHLNTMSQRFRIDAVVGLLGIIVLFTLGIFWLFHYHGYNEVQSQISFQLFPESSGTLLMLLCFNWMLTGIFDFPDMEGQKLLYARHRGKFAQWILLVSLMLFAQIFIFLLGLHSALEYSGSINQIKGEVLVGTFIAHQHTLHKCLFLGLLLVSFLAVLMNLQLWTGQLLQSVIPFTSVKFPHLPGMLIFLVGLVFWSLNTDGLWHIARYLLVITAGVGPVFLLRWYWRRITAQVQFIAMLAGLLVGNCYEISFKYWLWFKNTMLNLSAFLELSHYLTEVLISGIVTLCIWLLVALSSQGTSQEKWQSFQWTTGALARLKNKTLWLLLFIMLAIIVCAKILAWSIGFGHFRYGVLSGVFILICGVLMHLFYKKADSIE